MTEIVEGSKVTLKCESSGGPVPDSYLITKSGSFVTVKAFTAGHVLTNTFGAVHAGSYKCVTKNNTAGTVSEASDSLVLTLKGTFLYVCFLNKHNADLQRKPTPSYECYAVMTESSFHIEKTIFR